MLYNENDSQKKEIKNLQYKLKEMNVSSVDKDNQLSRLRQEICQYQHEKEDLERKLIVEEAKVECVYEKKMVEEFKVEKSSKEINRRIMEE